MNDVTMRDYQYRTPEWFQGKTFEGTAPFGPVLVAADEFGLGGSLRGEVDAEVVQQVSTDDLVFDPAALVSYISQIFTLKPGDVIATGTPAVWGTLASRLVTCRPVQRYSPRCRGSASCAIASSPRTDGCRHAQTM